MQDGRRIGLGMLGFALAVTALAGCADEDADASSDDAGIPMAGSGADDAGEQDAAEPPIPDTVDPGMEPWEPVPADEVEETCNLDPALLVEADATLKQPYAIIRYGQLCHEFYPEGEDTETFAEIYSATKTFGGLVTGIVAYQTRNIERSGRQTGPFSQWDRVDHWLDGFSYHQDAHIAHVLGMEAHNADLSLGAKMHSYDAFGGVQINTLGDIATLAINQDAERLGTNLEEFTQRFLYEPLGMTGSTWTQGAEKKNYAYSWFASIREMARVGLLMLNHGVWNGERLLSEAWVYEMTHPSFEDGALNYGYLTWLTSPSDRVTNCKPAALWDEYPHGELSMSPDCNYGPATNCAQQFDVGVWQANGLYGQIIEGHAGLDMVIVGRNIAGDGGALWHAVKAAVIAKDADYAGDEDAFCEAYSKGEHAPDLRTPWQVTW